MNRSFVTDNIDDLRIERLAAPTGWRITFQSQNPGMHHQLYVNGRLADYSDSTDQRSLHLDETGVPVRAVIAAVDPQLRAVDMSGLLPHDQAQPPWTFRIAAERTSRRATGTRLELLGDHASGQPDKTVLATAALNPPWAGLWGFGQDRFASGAMGYDAWGAPGAGRGNFGAGGFGFGGETAEIIAVLAEEGLHQLELHMVDPNGYDVNIQDEAVNSSPPPTPAESLSAVGYDTDTCMLTLHIQ